MREVICTKHPGAAEWLRRKGVDAPQITTPWMLEAPVHVYGDLHITSAAKVCGAGGRCTFIVMSIPTAMRGKEITADEMELCGAKLVEFRVEEVGSGRC